MTEIKLGQEPTQMTWKRCTQCNANQMEFQLREDGICQDCYVRNLEKENASLKEQLADSRKDFWRAVKNVEELKAQIENKNCCGNCKHPYERKVEQDGRCKDHYSDSVCENYESDEITADERLHNEKEE